MSIVEIEYQVTGMTCGHCEMSVREEVGQVPGVTAIDVLSLILISEPTSLRRIASAVGCGN